MKIYVEINLAVVNIVFETLLSSATMPCQEGFEPIRGMETGKCYKYDAKSVPEFNKARSICEKDKVKDGSVVFG